MELSARVASRDGDAVEALQEIEEATARLLNARDQADRALARLLAAGVRGGDAASGSVPHPAGVGPPEGHPGYNLSSARAIAAQLALDGASRDQAGRELARVLYPVESGDVEMLLDEAYGRGEASHAAPLTRTRSTD